MNPCVKGMDSEKLHDEIVIGAGHYAKGLRDPFSWSKAMEKDFGPGIKPYLNDMLARSKATYDAAIEKSLAKKIKARDIRYEKGAKAYEKRIAEGDYAQKVREKLPVTGESVAKKEAFEAARRKFEKFVSEKEFENQSALRRYTEKGVALSRWSKLTGIATIGKIGAAATVRVAQRTAEAAWNSFTRQLPYYGRIVEGAGLEGAGISHLPAYYRGVYRGLKDIPGIISGRIKTKEQIFHSPFSGRVTQALDRTSINLHAAGKRPAWRGAYEHAKSFLTKEAKEMGKDISQPEVLAQIESAARAAGDRSIFLKDNAASKTLSLIVNNLERGGGIQYAFGKAIRFMLPIVRVPTNIAGETISMSGGGLLAGLGKTLRIMGKSLDAVPQAEKAAIVRYYKKGMIGAGLFTTGLLLKDHFGQPYDPNHPAAEGEIRPGEAELFGVRIPKLLMHSPPMLAMQMGADVGHYMEDQIKKSGEVKEGENFAMAYGEALQHVLREVPFIQELSTIDSLLGGGWKSSVSNELGKQVRGVIPQAIQNVAGWVDEHDGDAAGWPWPLDRGYPVKRKPKGFVPQIQMGIPGLRGEVPTKEEADFLRKEMRKRARGGVSSGYIAG